MRKNQKGIISFLVLIVIALIIIGCILCYFFKEENAVKDLSTKKQEESTSKSCSQATKLCPDGFSIVGQVGSDCEYEQCPSVIEKKEDTIVVSENNSSTTATKPQEISTAGPFYIPVLVLNYFPLDKKDSTKIDLNIVGPYLSQGTTVSEMKQKTTRITEDLVSGLEKGSSYHGYSDSGSQPMLKYSIFETKDFLRPILRTSNSGWIFPEIGDWGFTADHYNELKNIDICDYVENKGVKEVWIWMYHYAPDLDGDGKADQDVNRYHVSPAESNMAGPYGDISNSYEINDLPICKKTYTVYEYNYTREFGEAIEDHTHQIEAILRSVNEDIFWNKFVGGPTSPFACGWTHCPPNVMSQCSTHNYDWTNEAVVKSDCEDWNDYRRGEIKNISCHTWAGNVCGSDSGDKFKVWWMQNIPENWWIYIGDFDKAMANKVRL